MGRRSLLQKSEQCDQAGLNVIRAQVACAGIMHSVADAVAMPGAVRIVWCEEGDSNPHTIAGVRT